MIRYVGSKTNNTQQASFIDGGDGKNQIYWNYCLAMMFSVFFTQC